MSEIFAPILSGLSDGSIVPYLGAGALAGVTEAYRVGGAYQDLASLLLLVTILMFRPQGMFGRASARQV